MAISETVIISFTFCVTIIFSVFGFVWKEYAYKMFFKVTAGLCCFILALMLFVAGDVDSTITVAFTSLLSGIAIIFFLLTIFDWNAEKKERFEREVSE